jgi:Uroporphyrinogen decarboxylase (URO-D)
MTSRERVQRTINFQPADRVPMDLGGHEASGITVAAYDRLKRKLGIKSATRVLDPRFMIAVVEEEILRRLHLDVLPVDTSAILSALRPDAEWEPCGLLEGTQVLMPPGTHIGQDGEGNWILLDAGGAPTSYRMPKGGYYFDDMSFNSGEGIDPKKFRPVAAIPDEHLEAFAGYAKRLYESTDYALLGWGYGVCFLGLSLITERSSNVTMGQPNDWMMMLMTEKATCHEMMDRSVEATINCLKLINQALGEYCFAWGIAADDTGTQRAEFIHPDLWAEMIKPHYTRLCAWVHQHTRMKTYLHCCGSVYRLIPHFIEAGVDILNPIQTSAANMDLVRLKREFGGKLVFWGGGCDTQHVLPNASPDAVRRQVRERLEIFAPGGGYVFNQVHNIQANVPPENILAMFDAAREFGNYVALNRD